MKNKFLFWIIGIVILIIIGIVFLRLGNGGEDNWIKDSKGVWIKHGNPAQTPDSVNKQKSVINCAKALYEQAKLNAIEFNSQCLGKCEDYSADIVHVPRTSDDNLAENQCDDYKSGVTNHFIELDKNGDIVRVVE